MGFLSFTTWQFALAGAICAAGPIIIHLLNRRRFRVVQWAAMDFLREAMQRNRRIMQIRDIILLVLRTAAVLLFGLALAQPFFASREEEFSERQPLHAVIVVDVAQKGRERMFLLAQSYMPAQEIHVLRNPAREGDPWYSIDFGETLVTPEWTFRRGDLKRF